MNQALELCQLLILSIVQVIGVRDNFEIGPYNLLPTAHHTVVKRKKLQVVSGNYGIRRDAWFKNRLVVKYIFGEGYIFYHPVNRQPNKIIA